MPAYIIAEIEVTDPVLYERYKPLAAAAIVAAGGRYLVRGGETVARKGRRRPGGSSSSNSRARPRRGRFTTVPAMPRRA